MNNHQPNAPPQQTAAVSIHDIIQMRVALAIVTNPSEELTQSLRNIDHIILLFTSSLNTAGTLK